MFTIKSPKGTRVKKVYYTDGARVKFGDPLFDLSDVDERGLIEHLKLKKSEAQERADEIASGEVDGTTVALQGIINHRAEIVNKCEIIAQAMRDEISVGKNSVKSLPPVDWGVTMAKYELLLAETEFSIFSINMVDQVEIADLIIKSIDKEIVYVEGIASRLCIKAPSAGRIRHSIIAGSPIDRGGVLCTID